LRSASGERILSLHVGEQPFALGTRRVDIDDSEPVAVTGHACQASAVMSIMAFRNDAMTSGLVFGAIAIGCAMLCYRTYVSRDELRSNFK